MSVVTWPRPRLRMRHPAQPEYAIEILGERMNELDRLPGKGPSYRHDSPDYVMHRRDCYLDWVELTENQLSELTYDTAAVVELLHTARYWEIRRLVPFDARPLSLIDAEIRYQKDALNRLRIDLEGAVTWKNHPSMPDDETLVRALVHDADVMLITDDADNVGREDDLDHVKRSIAMAEKILSGNASAEDRAVLEEPSST